MPAKNNLLGQRFGRLVVRAEAGSNKFGMIRWLCDCDCGNQTTATGCHLRGSTRSCGCLKRENAAKIGRELHPTHGHAGRGRKTRAYHSWDAMLQRCTNPNHKAYKNYGGRGIAVCDRWRDFEAFLADMGEPPEGLTLDRYPNNDGNYEPENCRWATREEQNAGRRPYRKR